MRCQADLLMKFSQIMYKYCEHLDSSNYTKANLSIIIKIINWSTMTVHIYLVYNVFIYRII